MSDADPLCFGFDDLLVWLTILQGHGCEYADAVQFARARTEGVGCSFPEGESAICP